MHVVVGVVGAIEAVGHIGKTIAELYEWCVWGLSDSSIVVFAGTLITSASFVIGECIYNLSCGNGLLAS